MDHLLDFAMQHWQLSLALVVILALLIRLESDPKVNGVTFLSPQEMIKLMNAHNAVVVDIRNAELYAQGHVIDALHIPLDEFEQKISKLDKFKEKPIVISCATGQTASKAGAILRKNDFTRVHALKGGIDAWGQENLPLTKAA